MQRWKLAAGAAVSSFVIAAGIFTVFSMTARAAEQTTCTGAAATAGGELICNIPQQDIDTPATISVTITTNPGALKVDLSWSTTCSDSSGNLTTEASATGAYVTTSGTADTTGTATADLTLSNDDPASCLASAIATIDSSVTASSVTSLGMEMDYTAQVASTATATASPTPTASATTSAPAAAKVYNNQVHGFDGTCLDDKSNSSKERAEVIIWSCNNTDQAQGWTFSDSELKIHGLCVNAKGSGKSGSKLILWKCTGSANEIFTHRSNGEFAEKANGYKLCVDDPAYKTKNGTQLFVYACNNGANQHFTKP